MQASKLQVTRPFTENMTAVFYISTTPEQTDPLVDQLAPQVSQITHETITDLLGNTIQPYFNLRVTLKRPEDYVYILNQLETTYHISR